MRLASIVIWDYADYIAAARPARHAVARQRPRRHRSVRQVAGLCTGAGGAIWSFAYAKNKNVKFVKAPPEKGRR